MMFPFSRFDQVRVSWLDFKLGFRMLVKYPGLTIVGGLSIAFGIAVGAASFEIVSQMIHPTIPIADGNRLVGLRLWDAASRQVDTRTGYELAMWRTGLESVEDIGAFRTVQRNLIGAEGRGEPIEVAEITASGLRTTRVSPLFGRSFVDADERAGAAPVILIGYDVWRSRFAADPQIVGRAVRLGKTLHTVVGVMPRGFAFPIAHSYWVPLSLDASAIKPGEGPDISVFGRLAGGTSLERAQTELTSVAARASADYREARRQTRPEIMPYARSIMPLPEIGSAGLMAVNVFFVMLLVLVCANVALLMFARAATREAEIAVRFALGASRVRIIGQLFAEALVLGGVASLVGLVAARFALRSFLAMSLTEAGGRLPFWFSDALSATSVLYAIMLALVAAVISGIIPALKVTGRGLEARLRQAATSGGLRFGGVWTWVIVGQVAVTVAFPAGAFFAARYVNEMQSIDAGFPSAEYLFARLGIDPDITSRVSADSSRVQLLARSRATTDELERRLMGEARVSGVTFADRLPRTHHAELRVEMDNAGAVSPNSVASLRVGGAAVAPNYFDVLGAPILSGRGFQSTDVESARRVVIVNQSFVARVLRGRNPIGRRIRYVGGDAPEQRSPWYEIVGVVRDLGVVTDDPHDASGVYHPVSPGTLSPINLIVHVKGNPELFAPQLRAIAASVDPTLRLHDIAPLEELGKTMWTELQFMFRLLTVVSGIALLLSLAGIYAVMAFTVSRRTREIGIRVALGARPRRVIAAIFARPLTQVGVGILAGASMTALLAFAVEGGALTLTQSALVIAYAGLMMLVCLLACVVPTRRALKVQPTEALRADG